MSHYVALGDCAARVYYKPLDVTDYILFPIVGIACVFISLRYIRTNKAVRYIEVAIYSIIIMFILVFGNEILASRTIDWPETYQVAQIKKKPTGNILSGYIENKDSVYAIVDGWVSSHFDSENYSYKGWENKTRELVGVETCIHDNDYDYLGHEINVLEYLNWHLLKRISLYGDTLLVNELKTDIALLDSLLYSQYDLIDAYLPRQSTRYDHCGICIEQKQIINENLQDVYMVFTNGLSKFQPRRITQMDNAYYECPNIGDSLIEEEYQRFISECVLKYQGVVRPEAEREQIMNNLLIEKMKWSEFVVHRELVESLISGDLKSIWAYETKVWKLNKLRQLKNEFECYGTMSELDYKLSLQNCNFIELMNYRSFSSEWKNHESGQ